MKILILHSYYQKRGGEDVTFEQEQLLVGQSEQVRTIAFANQPGIRGLIQFVLSIWNIGAARKLKNAIREFRPDVLHCHNLHFGIGPIAIRVAGKLGVPVILTLQNYRLICPSGTFVIDGELYTESIKSAFPWKAIRKKAFRNSLFLSFWLAFIIWFHKKIGTWKKVDRFIVMTEFAKTLFRDSAFGIPAEKMAVKPNYVDPVRSPAVSRGEHFLFVGRLSVEKGIVGLLEAFRRTGHPLRIVGEGPLEPLVLQAAKTHANIQFLGPMDKEGVYRQLSETSVLVFPSIWYEGFPMIILESLSSGTPLIASNLGAMSVMITDGYNGRHFEAGNVEALIGQLNAWAEAKSDEKEAYSINALSSYQSHHTPEKNREKLIGIYKQQVRGMKPSDITG